MKMRVLMSYENLLPSKAADAEVFLNTAGALAARGYDATVATPEPPDVAPTFEQDILKHYGIEAPLHLTTMPSVTKNIAVQHAYHALHFPEHPLFHEADFIYARNPVTVMRALQAGQRVFMDHYRPWGDQFPPLQPIFRRFMTHPRFLGLVVHSAYSARSYERLGVPQSKLRVIHNGFDPRRIEPVLSKQEARSQLDLPQDRRIVVYTGRIDEKKGLDVVLDLARVMPEVTFVLVGSTGHGAIETEAATIPNVEIAPWQHDKGIARYLYAADVLTIPPSTEPLKSKGNAVLPLKTFLYLAAGRAIFAAESPDTAEIFAHDRNAWLVPPGDVPTAERQLRRLLNDEGLLERLSQAAHEESKERTWAGRAAKIDAFIQERLASDGTDTAGPWSATGCLRDTAKWFVSGASTGNWVYGG